MISLTKGRKEIFYLATHFTHFIFGYIMAYGKGPLGERKPPTATTWATLFEQQQRFFYMHHLRQDKPYHSPCYISCGALAGKRDSSVGPISGIDPMTHHIMSRYSATELIET